MSTLSNTKRNQRGLSTEPHPARTRYQDDLYTWAIEQVELLRAGRVDDIDFVNIAEELQDVSGREYDKLESALMVILLHMLKWDHQPERRTRSWANSIGAQRVHVERQLRKFPGLKSRFGEAVEEAYEDARRRTAIETSIETVTLPISCPYDWDEIETREFVWPPAAPAKER